jgi:hypothetical protein
MFAAVKTARPDGFVQTPARLGDRFSLATAESGGKSVEWSLRPCCWPLLDRCCRCDEFDPPLTFLFIPCRGWEPCNVGSAFMPTAQSGRAGKGC